MHFYSLWGRSSSSLLSRTGLNGVFINGQKFDLGGNSFNIYDILAECKFTWMIFEVTSSHNEVPLIDLLSLVKQDVESSEEINNLSLENYQSSWFRYRLILCSSPLCVLFARYTMCHAPSNDDTIITIFHLKAMMTSSQHVLTNYIHIRTYTHIHLNCLCVHDSWSMNRRYAVGDQLRAVYDG